MLVLQRRDLHKAMKVVIADSFVDSLNYLGSWRFKVKEFFRNIHDFIFKPYTTIKPRHVNHRWHDSRDLLVHFSFELLQRYLDEEADDTDEMCRVLTEDNLDEHERERLQAWFNVLCEMEELLYWFEEDYLPYWDGSNVSLLFDLQPEPISLFQEDEETGLVRYDPVFESEDDELLYDGVFWAIRDYRETMEEEIEDSLIRLAALRPYMWS